MACAIEVSGLLGHPIMNVKNRMTAADLLLLISPLLANHATFWEADA
jgi:hypothetical protein